MKPNITLNEKEILGIVDHTLLRQSATWEEIKFLCYQGISYHTASVCIPPCFVKKAKDYVQNELAICTVIGFPNGYSTTASKVFETQECIQNGADEIDMVINIGWVKEKNYNAILAEIKAVKHACKNKILKVIIETCLLSETEKKLLCDIVSESGAEFIKTSTGFSTGGATLDDIKLMKKYVSPHVKIKAAGGVGSFEDARNFIETGADRLGTSRLIP